VSYNCIVERMKEMKTVVGKPTTHSLHRATIPFFLP